MKKRVMSAQEAEFLKDFKELIEKYEHSFSFSARILGSTYKEDVRHFVQKHFDRLHAVGLLHSEYNESPENPRLSGKDRLTQLIFIDISLLNKSVDKKAKQAAANHVMEDVKNAIDEQILSNATKELYRNIIEPRLALPVAQRALENAKVKFKESEKACATVLKEMEILKQKQGEMDPALFKKQLEELDNKYQGLRLQFDKSGARVEQLMQIVNRRERDAPDDRSIQAFHENFKDLLSSQEQIETLFNNIRDEVESEVMNISIADTMSGPDPAEEQRKEEIHVLLDDKWIDGLKDEIKTRFDHLPSNTTPKLDE